jgi:transcriptional regulator with XRE-family HTH domain
MEKHQNITAAVRVGERIEVAEALGIDQPQYSRIINGKGRFTPDQLNKLGDLLRWPVDDFMSTGPLVVRVENNHGGNNGYNVTENLQQHTIPVELVERMLEKNEDRWEMMMKHMLEFMERVLKKG